MANNDIKLDCYFGNNQTLDTFIEILKYRMQFLNETARDSVAAMCVNVLKSVKAATKVAKPSKIKINIEQDNNLCLSYYLKKPVLRNKHDKHRYIKKANEKIVFYQRNNNANVYRWEYFDLPDNKTTTYLITAISKQDARTKAKDIVKKYYLKYSGLAKNAISLLIQKTQTIKSPLEGAFEAKRKADDLTFKEETVSKTDENSGTYKLILTDNVLYAKNAIKGGESMLDSCMQKALNKTVAQINHKVDNQKFWLSQLAIESPFPEIRKGTSKNH